MIEEVRVKKKTDFRPTKLRVFTPEKNKLWNKAITYRCCVPIEKNHILSIQDRHKWISFFRQIHY